MSDPTQSTDARFPGYRPVAAGGRRPGPAPAGDAATTRRTADPALTSDPPAAVPPVPPPAPAPAAPAEPSAADRFKDSVASAATAVAATAKEGVSKLSDAVSGRGPGRADTAAGTPAAAAATPARKPTRRTRKARLRISRIDPWSVMKTALLFGVAGGIIFVVATFVVMTVIESTGVYAAINGVVGDMLSAPSDNSFSIETFINTRRVTGFAAVIGAVDVVIFTALATVFSFLYNLSATMLGGLEITLAED